MEHAAAVRKLLPPGSGCLEFLKGMAGMDSLNKHVQQISFRQCVFILPTSASCKAGSPTSNPLLLKAQSRQLLIGLQQSHSTNESTITAFVTNRGDRNSMTKPSAFLHKTGFSCSCNEGMGRMQPQCKPFKLYIPKTNGGNGFL